MQAGDQLLTADTSPAATPTDAAAGSPLPARRYHGLDLLRAVMMSLGVVLHVAINYQTSPADGAWPYRDPNPVGLAGVLVLVVHAFRMPVFFVLAGFFAAMTRDRLGIAGLVASRARRIALPMVVGWFVLFPVTNFGFHFGAIRAAGTPISQSLSAAAAQAFANPWDNPSPLHLWFLYYLLILLGVVSASAAALPARVRAIATKAIGSLIRGRWRRARLPVMALLTWLTLLPMHGPSIDTPGSFVPRPRVLICYGIFFMAGWFMFAHRAMIDELRVRAGLRLAAGAGTMGIYIILAGSWYLAEGSEQPPPATVMAALRVAAVAVLSLTIWLLVLGGIGFAERVVRRSSTIVRFVVDSSFWIYLVHLPLCVVVPVLLRDWNAPGLVKLTLSVAIVLAISLTGYEALRNVLPRRAAP